MWSTRAHVSRTQRLTVFFVVDGVVVLRSRDVHVLALDHLTQQPLRLVQVDRELRSSVQRQRDSISSQW